MVCLFPALFKKQEQVPVPGPCISYEPGFRDSFLISWFPTDSGTRDRNLVSGKEKKRVRGNSQDLANVSMMDGRALVQA